MDRNGLCVIVDIFFEKTFIWQAVFDTREGKEGTCIMNMITVCHSLINENCNCCKIAVV